MATHPSRLFASPKSVPCPPGQSLSGHDCPLTFLPLLLRFLKWFSWRHAKGHRERGSQVMKALCALIVIYVGTFFFAIQGASNSSVQAAGQDATVKGSAKTIDPQKESDIRSLLELIGARDTIQDAANNSTEQYR